LTYDRQSQHRSFEIEMKKSLMSLLLALALVISITAGETEPSANPASAPHNTAMLSIVVNPEPTHVGDGGPFDWVAAVVPMATTPSGHLIVTAISGVFRLPLYEHDIPGGYVDYGYYPVDGPTHGGHYIVESFFYGIPPGSGFSLVNGKLPPGTSIEATLIPSTGISVTVRTTSVITGVQQSLDGNTIVVGGKFNPAVPAFIYWTREAVPVRPEAVTVSGDRIVIDLTKDPDTASWTADTYSVVVYQPATERVGAIDDTFLFAKSNTTIPSRTRVPRTFPEHRRRTGEVIPQ
jgi:hypothetical protein